MIRAELKRQKDPKRAEGEKKYLKSTVRHYGVSLPKLEKILREWKKAHPKADIDEVVKLCKALWASPWHEEKTSAVELLALYADQLRHKHLPFIEKMICGAKTWAHIDPIAILLVGSIIENDKKTLIHLPKWAADTNFWVRRVAILSQILQFRKGVGDFKLFERIVIPMFQEGSNWSKEERFFVRKAIGWALRELAPRKPQVVFSFLKEYRDHMSGLTFKEGSRKLPSDLQQILNRNS